MPRFFVEDLSQGQVVITGEDARHIALSLRMAPGDPVTLCDGRGTDAACRLLTVEAGQVAAAVESRMPSAAEPPVALTLYQALPKGDKLELVVQKAVELGVGAVVPVLTRYCVSRPDGKAMEKKRERLQKIALEAAKQAGRGVVPRVEPLCSFGEALARMAQVEAPILFYEKARTPLGQVLEGRPATAAVMVGPEGGFSTQEVEEAQRAGVRLCTMGPRILRCETAPLYALSAITFYYENMGLAR